jgi:HSP20 family molecular chaperone IbpA
MPTIQVIDDTTRNMDAASNGNCTPEEVCNGKPVDMGKDESDDVAKDKPDEVAKDKPYEVYGYNSDQVTKDKEQAEDAVNGNDGQDKTSPKLPQKKRHQWYQTESVVVVSILLRGVKDDQLTVDLTDKSMSVSIKRESPLPDYSLELDFAHAIDSEQSSWKVQTAQIEIKLKKREAFHWGKLESDGTASNLKKFRMLSKRSPTRLPSQAIRHPV